MLSADTFLLFKSGSTVITASYTFPQSQVLLLHIMSNKFQLAGIQIGSYNVENTL